MGELVRAVVGTVVDVEPQRKSPAGECALEHRQERGGALGEVEGGEGEHAGGIVDEGHEEGLSASAPIADLRSVHDIAHPQLAGVAEGEASPVDGDGLAGAFVEKAFAREQPMHRRGSQRALDSKRTLSASNSVRSECRFTVAMGACLSLGLHRHHCRQHREALGRGQRRVAPAPARRLALDALAVGEVPPRIARPVHPVHREVHP